MLGLFLFSESFLSYKSTVLPLSVIRITYLAVFSITPYVCTVLFNLTKSADLNTMGAPRWCARELLTAHPINSNAFRLNTTMHEISKIYRPPFDEVCSVWCVILDGYQKCPTLEPDLRPPNRGFCGNMQLLHLSMAYILVEIMVTISWPLLITSTSRHVLLDVSIEMPAIYQTRFSNRPYFIVTAVCG